MKLVQLYLIGAFVTISLLAVSTWWQFQQFQNNLHGLSFQALPGTSAVTDFNSQLGQIVNQLQNKAPEQKIAPGATGTLEYQTPDGQMTVVYPSDWQTSGDQSLQNASGTTLFSAFKMSISTTAAVNYLTIIESNATSTDALIAQYKKEIQDKGTSVRFAQSEIVNGQQTIPLVRITYKTTEATTGIIIGLDIQNAVVAAGNKIYVVSVMMQGSDPAMATEADNILNSIKTIATPASTTEAAE